MIAAAQRDLAVKQAEYKANVEAEQARAALAGGIATAEREKELRTAQAEADEAQAEAQAKGAIRQAELAEKTLIAEKIKPAEAERDAMKIRAEGEKQAKVIAAEATKEAAVTEAKALAGVAEARAEAAENDAKAIKAKADADGHAKKALGEGQATAEATLIRQRGEAEGAAIGARLNAEAEGIQKKNAALAQMSDGARMILILDRLPEVLDHAGDALAKALTPAFQAMGAGLAAVDKIEIVDLGGGSAREGGSPLERFALSIPMIALKVATEAGKMGVDVRALFAKAGIKLPSDGTQPMVDVKATRTDGGAGPTS